MSYEGNTPELNPGEMNESGQELNMAEPAELKPSGTKKRPRRKKGVPLALTIFLCLLLFAAGSLFGGTYLSRANSRDTGLNGNNIIDKLSALRMIIDGYFLDEYDEKKLEEGIYSGYMSALGDPYSQYYTEEEYRQLMEEDSGEYRGIGVTVTKNQENNYTEIMAVNKGDPAYNAGIKTGDFIMKVNGKDTSVMSLSEVVTEIKTSEDPVVLVIYQAGKEMEVSVEKSTISINSVSFEMRKNNIGYISVSQFIDNTDDQFMEAVQDLEKQGMKGLILDLRDNGGGLLNACVNMVSQIIPEGDLIVYTQDKNGNRQDYTSNEAATLDVPIVVLANSNTASASEIMTGCLKDYGLATVLGTKTYGKGIVQSILPLSDGSAVKLTVSAYYTPKGVNIHKKGIEPDIEMEMTDEEWKEARDDLSKDKQIKKAEEILLKAETGKK